MKVLIEMFLTHILNTRRKCIFLNFKYMKSDVRFFREWTVLFHKYLNKLRTLIAFQSLENFDDAVIVLSSPKLSLSFIFI